jgi:hypothetical protein
MRHTTTCVLAAGVLALAVSPAARSGGDKEAKAENPFYKHWAGFKPGTIAVHTEKTTFGDDATDELPGGVDERVITYKLLSVSPRRVVVETTVTEKEFLSRIVSPPTKVIYPAKVNKAYLKAMLFEGGAKHGEQTLKVRLGKQEQEIQCKTLDITRKKKGEDVRQEFWYSTSVPGGVVKRIRTTSHDGALVAKTTTTLRAYKAAE